MIVISNTSPLTNLAAIGQFHLLHLRYEKIHIAEGVWAEIQPYLDALRHAAGFYMSDSVYQRILDLAEE